MMYSQVFQLFVVILGCTRMVSGFRSAIRPTSRVVTKQALSTSDVFSFTNSFLTAVGDKPDDYKYGSVAAPDWALPLGAVLVILTAALPFLLKGGEEALVEQRKNEETVNNVFGDKGNGVTNKRKKL
jgi:hypothetical protein